MITLCRHDRRRHEQHDKLEHWQTFYPHAPPEVTDHGLGALANIHELRIPPGRTTARRLWNEAEVLTYVYQGALTYESFTGGPGVLRAGDFQRMSTGRCVRHGETNASGEDWAHLFQIALHPCQIGTSCALAHQRFTIAQRRNKLCVVASSNGRRGSLQIQQDATILSSDLDQGHHLVHELASGRSTWLHIICGEVTLGNVTLSRGDGAGITDEPVVSLTARERTELLLVDVHAPSPTLTNTPRA